MTSSKKKVMMKNSSALKTGMKKSSNHRIQFDCHCHLQSWFEFGAKFAKSQLRSNVNKNNSSKQLAIHQAQIPMSVIEIRFSSPCILKYLSSYLKKKVMMTTPLLTFLVAAGKKIVKSQNTNRLPLLFDEFYIIIIYYFRSAELDDILEEESDDDNSSASPPVISSPSSNSPDGSFRLPGSSSRHRNQQVNTESTSSASSTDGRVGTPPLTSRSKGPSSRSSGRVSFTILSSIWLI